MSYYQLFYHVVWGTKNRERTLTSDVERVVHNLVRSKAEDLEADVFAIDGVEDHVHMIATIPPKISLAKFVGQVKGASSATFNKTGLFPKSFFWQEDYGIFSFDRKSLGNHIAYVKMQKYHHYGAGEVIPILERTDKPKVDLSQAMEVREDGEAYLVEDAIWRQEMMAYDKG